MKALVACSLKCDDEVKELLPLSHHFHASLMYNGRGLQGFLLAFYGNIIRLIHILLKGNIGYQRIPCSMLHALKANTPLTSIGVRYVSVMKLHGSLSVLGKAPGVIIMPEVRVIRRESAQNRAMKTFCVIVSLKNIVFSVLNIC